MPKKLAVHNCEDCKHFRFYWKNHCTEFTGECTNGRKMPRRICPKSPIAENYGYRTRCSNFVKEKT